MADSDIDMGGTAAGFLDQMHTGFSSTSTPINSFPTPQPHLSAIPSSAATPANLNVPSPLPAQAPTSQRPPTTQPDVHMGDAETNDATTTAPDQGTGSGDWIVVPKDGMPPVSGPTTTTTQPSAAVPSGDDSKPGSAAATPGDVLDGDNNDFSSLGDLDTAGDALASYDPPSGDELNMDLEDSAFGDAFHGVEQAGGGTGPDTPAAEGL